MRTGAMLGDQSDPRVKVTIHHNLEPTLRMRGAISPFPISLNATLLNIKMFSRVIFHCVIIPLLKKSLLTSNIVPVSRSFF
jgi:hypothetical protein